MLYIWFLLDKFESVSRGSLCMKKYWCCPIVWNYKLLLEGCGGCVWVYPSYQFGVAILNVNLCNLIKSHMNNLTRYPPLNHLTLHPERATPRWCLIFPRTGPLSSCLCNWAEDRGDSLWSVSDISHSGSQFSVKYHFELEIWIWYIIRSLDIEIDLEIKRSMMRHLLKFPPIMKTCQLH